MAIISVTRLHLDFDAQMTVKITMANYLVAIICKIFHSGDRRKRRRGAAVSGVFVNRQRLRDNLDNFPL
jgi:hypothetical protein